MYHALQINPNRRSSFLTRNFDFSTGTCCKVTVWGLLADRIMDARWDNRSESTSHRAEKHPKTEKQVD